MRRILIFSLAYYPHVGGAEVALKEITDRLEDIEFHMLTLNFGGAAKEEKIGNVVVHRLGNSASYLSKILFVPRAALAARTLHRSIRFDGFWAMMTYMLFPIVLARFLGVRTSYLLTLQDGDPFEHVFTRWFILPFRPLLTRGFKSAAAVQTISHHLAAWAARMGSKATPVVVPNGVDVRTFSRDIPKEEIHALQQLLGKKNGETWLIHTGRMVQKNGLDTVIRALPLLPSPVHFLQVGIGQDEAALRLLAKELGVESRVHFRGFVESRELPAYLAACDIFIRPSRSEGMGNSFIEAMAAGMPVIGSQEGGIADFLFDAKRNPEREATGYAVDANNPSQIARAVQEIQDHPEDAYRAVEVAKRLVEEKYEWDGIAERMGRVMLTLTRTRKRLVLATPLYPPESGGPATYAHALEHSLPEHGWDVTMVKFRDVRGYPRLIRHMVYMWRVFRAARHADAVLALDPVSVGLPSCIAARLRRKPFYLKVVGDYAWEQGTQRFGVTETLDAFAVSKQRHAFPVRVMRAIQYAVARRAASVIVPSVYWRSLLANWGMPPERIEVIYNAAPPVPETLSRPVSAPTGSYIVTIARLVPWKGVDGVIRAVAKLREEGTSISLVIVDDGPERRNLEMLVDELRAKDLVTFTGRLPHDETLAYLKHADAFVLNTGYEGFSHLILEAFSVGTPVLTTPVGGNTEAVEDGVTGLVFQHQDVTALTEVLRRILSDGALRKRVAEQAKERLASFSKESMIDGVVRILP